MLATQTPDPLPEVKDVKQRIKERLALSLKALQKRYVTSDAVVTSEDDANLLCSALEAIFICGIKSKYIRAEAGGRGRKGDRSPLPQPVFWGLLKTVTHRDVITELEKLSFVSTDVGRCRAWLRLALNHGLLECYLASLFREGSKLQAHYQPSSLLLDSEEREVLLSYLQGLASLSFNLSYKSAVLNEWTTTPLALAGLCPASQMDAILDLPLKPARKESWDTASQSSGGSDTVEVKPGGLGMLAGKANGAVPWGRTALNSSNLSLDTTGSSQLSSSLSSDSLLQGQDPRSPTREQWPSCDLDNPHNGDSSTKKPLKDSMLADFREGGHSSQDSMREEDSFVSSTTGPLDLLSETTAFSGSDSEAQGPSFATTTSSSPSPDAENPPPDSPLPNPEPSSSFQSGVSRESEENLDTGTVPGVQEAPEVVEQQEKVEEMVPTENAVETASESSTHSAPLRSTSVLSRKMSSDSIHHSLPWISEDDFYKPYLEEVSDLDEAPGPVPPCYSNGPTSTPPEPKLPQSPPSVVHRREIGLSNPFRGLLKLGHLERRGAVGIWRDYYCELSPYEFRLYLNAEERTCCDNFSLLRCEDVRVTSPEGRFELAFPGKRLYLRAANHDEAEDWVDRIVEAVNKCRPSPCADDHWEVLQLTRDNVPDENHLLNPASAPTSPEHVSSTAEQGASGSQQVPPSPPQLQDLDWSRPAEVEQDAIKEAVLYLSTDPEGRTWVPLVLSLSLEALKGYRVQEGRKVLRLSNRIESIRDVVPDVSQGGAEFFKLLTVKETLKLRAESPEEARTWRSLIRGALDSYLESGEEGAVEGPALSCQKMGGNISRLVQHRLKEDGVLLNHLCTVPAEKGLDIQGFKCAGCPKQIGLSMGKARLCEFSGQYYCSSCHRGDTTIIPARMVHNWDLEPREVSRKALKLLAQIADEPLLNVEQLNPDLVEHAEPMAQAYDLRRRLRLLGDYLLTCRSSACKKVKARIGNQTYLLESSNLYSVRDLRQIAEGQYAASLSKLVQFASNHVHHCDLCTQRGFICQICHASDIIFPFQFDSTTRCKDCKALFHNACKAHTPSCPRCLRLQKYLERDLQD